MIGILLVSHGGLAKALRDVSFRIVGPQDGVLAVCVADNEGPAEIREKVGAALDQLNGFSGVLILADLYGGSGANICRVWQASRSVPVEMVCGVNLPALIEALTHRDGTSLPELADKVVQTGHRGLLRAKPLTRTKTFES